MVSKITEKQKANDQKSKLKKTLAQIDERKSLPDSSFCGIHIIYHVYINVIDKTGEIKKTLFTNLLACMGLNIPIIPSKYERKDKVQYKECKS